MHRTRIAAATASALIALAMITGCASAGTGAPDAPASGVPTPNPASASAQPTSSPTPSPGDSDPAATPPATGPNDWTADATRFTTQNGTASFLVPAGWRVEDSSELGGNHNNEAQWHNLLAVVDDEQRTVLQFLDGPFDDAGLPDAVTVVSQRAVTDEVAATAWMYDEGGRVRLHAELADVAHDVPFAPVAAVEGRNVIFRVDLAAIDGCAPAMADVAEGRACLESDAVDELLDVIGSLELHDVPWDALPAGVSPPRAMERPTGGPTPAAGQTCDLASVCDPSMPV